MGSVNRIISSLISASVLLSCDTFDESLLDSSLVGLPARPAASTSSPSDDLEAIFAFPNMASLPAECDLSPFEAVPNRMPVPVQMSFEPQ